MSAINTRANTQTKKEFKCGSISMGLADFGLVNIGVVVALMSVGSLTPLQVMAQSQAQINNQSENLQRWQHCEVFSSPQVSKQISSSNNRHIASPDTQISADQAKMFPNNIYELTGQVTIRRDNTELSTDQAHYEAAKDHVIANGNVRLQAGKVLLLGSKAEYFLDKKHGIINDAQIWLPDRHFRGIARDIQFSEHTSQLSSVQFTSCNQGNNDWVLRASELELDTENNVGIAKHARIEFLGVPIFYFPYMSFPLEGRKTGFLVPIPGHSNRLGKQLSTPFYWNLAPNYDATITPHFYSQRGNRLESQFRYLGRKQTAELLLDVLPQDRLDEETRHYVQLKQHIQPSANLGVDVLFQQASGADYLTDFASDLYSSSQSHLPRHLTIDYVSDVGHINLLTESYQTLDQSIVSTSTPYDRLPQLRFNSASLQLPFGVQSQFEGEWVTFDRKESLASNDLSGSRFDIEPSLWHRFQDISGFLEPILSIKHTRYSLKNSFNGDANQQRTLPLLSVDSGLYFDRRIRSNGKQDQLLQTLEPRLFYLYVPYRDQSQLIVDQNGDQQTFDTGLVSFEASQLFQRNRFSGIDRIGDANQLSYSLTSRIYNNSGRELANASFGQVYYFKKPQVSLPDQNFDDRSYSNVFLHAAYYWQPQISSSVDLLWNPAEQQNTRGSFKFRYQPNQDKMAQLWYSYEKDQIDQAKLLLLWRVLPQWKLLANWQYSFIDGETLESYQGLEYSSCCWAVRLVQREFIEDNASGTHNQATWFQLELKGLASVGNKVERLFRAE